MLRSTFPVSRIRPEHHVSTPRRLVGVLALLALLATLPSPALAAPAEGSPALSGATVLDWIQGFLARFGVLETPSAARPEAPTSVHERLGPGMDPGGVAGYANSTTSDDSGTLGLGGAVPTQG